MNDHLTGSLFFRLCSCASHKDEVSAAPDVAEVLGRDEAESVAAKPGANLIDHDIAIAWHLCLNMQVTINVAMASLTQASRWAEALYLQAGELYG